MWQRATNAPRETDCDGDLILPDHQYNYYSDRRNTTHKPPTYSVNNDIFPLLTILMESAENISSKQFNQILNAFVDKFNHKTLLKLIYHGLIATYYHKNDVNAMEWLKYLNKSMDITPPNESMLTTATNIDNLHLDSLSSICKFLSLEDIQSLELCNRNLLKTIRNNPQCITSYHCNLLDPNMSYLLYRLCGIKQLTLSSSGMPIRSTQGIDNERIMMDYIGSNITKLILYYDIEFGTNNNYKFSSLEVLHVHNVTMHHHVITNLHLFALFKIKDLMIDFGAYGYNFNRNENKESRISFINALLQFKKLEKLKICGSNGRVIGIGHQDSCSDVNIEPAEYPAFFNNLREFYWGNECIATIYTMFVHCVLQNCINLKVLNVNDVCNEAEYANYNGLEELHLFPGGILSIQLLNYLIDYRIVLRKIVVAFDNISINVKDLDSLKLLLESQFYQHDMLKDICLTINDETQMMEYMEIDLPHLIASMYLMLIDVVNDSRFKPLKSLNIRLNIPSESDKKCFHPHLVGNLLDSLYKKVEHCCFDFNTGIFGAFSRASDYDKKWSWCNNEYICRIAWHWDEIVVFTEWMVILETICSGFVRMIKPKAFGIETDISIPSISTNTSLTDIDDDNLSISMEELRFQHSFDSKETDENDIEEVIVDKIECARYPLKGWLFIQLQDLQHTEDNNEKKEVEYSGKMEKTIQKQMVEDGNDEEKEMQYGPKGKR